MNLVLAKVILLNVSGTNISHFMRNSFLPLYERKLSDEPTHIRAHFRFHGLHQEAMGPEESTNE